MKKYLLLIYLVIFKHIADNVNLLHKNALTNDGKKYLYASSFSLGLSPNFLRIFASANSVPDQLKNINLYGFFSVGISLEYYLLLSNMFCAKTFGFFPKIGFSLQIFDMNYIHSYFEWLFISCAKLCMCKFNDIHSPKHLSNSHFTLNIFPFVFSPEVNLFKRFRCVPKFGIGLSIINLTRDCKTNANNKIKIYPKYIDLALLMHVSFIWKNKPNYETEFVIGYTYNPLLLYNYNNNKSDKYTEGGLMNIYIGINFNWIFNLGLETIDWFDPDFNKIKYYKKQLFIDTCLSIGNWYKFSIDNNVSKETYFDIFVSLNFPYLKKLDDNLYYGVSIDIFEDLFNNAYRNDNLNFFKKCVNNFNVVFNFISFNFVYKTIRFTHNLGIYILTNLWTTFSNPQDMKYFGQREISEMTSGGKDAEYKSNFIHYLFGRFTYRPRIYINIPKMIKKRLKHKIFDKFSLILGINFIIFDKRNDWKKRSDTSFDIEFVKIESFFFGISYEI